MNTERAEKLVNYFKADEKRAENLFQMDIEKALEKINSDGNDFTVEELREFAEILVNLSEKKDNEELDERELENAAGGEVARLQAKIAGVFFKIGFTGGCHVRKYWG